MFVTKKALPRRTFLKAAGVTVALPLLDSMVPAATALAQTPAAPIRRFGAVYVPHGLLQSQWLPATTGRGFEFSPILKPLEPFRDQITVLSGLSAGPTVLNGGHAVAPASYLSGNVQPKQTENSDVRGAVTVDQVMAAAIGQETTFPSLELATEDFSTSLGACDTGYSCIYMNTISWADARTPLPMETNPRTVFERMFGTGGSPAERQARMRTDRSILDGIAESVARLQQGLGAPDRSRLSTYLDNVREIERRIQRAEAQADEHPLDLSAPVGPPEAYDEHVSIMFELLAAAFRADLTRVFTFMAMRDITSRAFPHIGVPDPHHALSHEANGRSDDPNQQVKFARVNTHHTSLFAAFVARLASIEEGDGTLLDRSTVLFGSSMSNANDHTHSPLPLVVLGGGAGRMRRRGEHIASPPNTPMANLLLALAQKVGVETETFGESSNAMEV
ncbi:MAG: DUF1552 domain-containing protein [Vicinamibacterales bacterium]